MTDREAFEAWMQDDPDIEWPTMEDALWEAWQAALAQRTEPQQQANEDLAFIERWAVHHAKKTAPDVVLGVIRNYPPIRAITEALGEEVQPQQQVEPMAHYECSGCGHVTNDPDGDLSDIRAKGYLSCCPDRKMIAAPPAVQVEPVTLERWGMKSPSTWPFFEKMDDGYWTPWHIANEALQRAAPPAVQAVTDQMIDSYLEANSAYWREVDAKPFDATKPWRQGTPREATRTSLEAALRAALPAVQGEPTDQLIARLRSLASELDADDSPEQIHPGVAICSQAADMLEAFRLQRDLDGPAWERHVERMRLAEDEVQRLKACR